MEKLDIEVDTPTDWVKIYTSYMRTRNGDLDFLLTKIFKLCGFPIFWI